MSLNSKRWLPIEQNLYWCVKWVGRKRTINFWWPLKGTVQYICVLRIGRERKSKGVESILLHSLKCSEYHPK